MYDWETFQAAYQNATEAQKAFIDSEAIPACVQMSLDTNQLDASYRSKLIKLCTFQYLSTFDQETIQLEIEKLGISESEHFLTQLTTCLSDVSTQPTSDDAEIAAEENTYSTTVPAVRTMAGDAAKAQAGGNTEPTYTSSQETLLGESPAKSDTPAQQ